MPRNGSGVAIERYRRLPSEWAMQEAIAELVELRGGRLWHVRDSRALGVEDAPDLMIVVPGLAAWIEVKSQSRPVTPGQQEVAALLASVTKFVGGVMRPDPKPGELSYEEVLRLLGDGG